MAFDPFWMFRPSLLRDMNQNINPSWFSPSLNVNLAGNAAVEEKVVTEVASYGRQIGWLNELIVAIVEASQSRRRRWHSCDKPYLISRQSKLRTKRARYIRPRKHWIDCNGSTTQDMRSS